MQANNPAIKIICWGYPELLQEVLSLDESLLAEFFGVPPRQENFAQLGFRELEPILTHISGKPALSDDDIRPPSPKKIAANALSPSVERYLKLGMTKCDVVESFFNQWHDPLLAERVIEAFKCEYLKIRDELTDTDVIFQKMQIFAGGELIGTPKHQEAVITVLAYLFERCHIFERPREET